MPQGYQDGIGKEIDRPIKKVDKNKQRVKKHCSVGIQSSPKPGNKIIILYKISQ